MTFELPEGAKLLCTIKIENGEASTEWAFDYEEVVEETVAQIEAYVEEHGEVPEFIKPWNDLAQDCAEWQAREAVRKRRES